MVIMASGIAHGRVRMTVTTTVEPRNMAAMLQLVHVDLQRHASLFCSGTMSSFLGEIFLKEMKTHAYQQTIVWQADCSSIQ